MSIKKWTVDDWYSFLTKFSEEFRVMGMDEQGKVCMDCVRCVEGKSHISSPLSYYAVKDARRNFLLQEIKTE